MIAVFTILLDWWIEADLIGILVVIILNQLKRVGRDEVGCGCINRCNRGCGRKQKCSPGSLFREVVVVIVGEGRVGDLVDDTIAAIALIDSTSLSAGTGGDQLQLISPHEYPMQRLGIEVPHSLDRAIVLTVRGVQLDSDPLTICKTGLSHEYHRPCYERTPTDNRGE
jgi:hypothetical protein